MSAMNLAADNAAQCRATQSSTGIAANQVTCYTTQYCAGSGIALGLVHICACTQRSGDSNQGNGFSQSLFHVVFSISRLNNTQAVSHKVSLICLLISKDCLNYDNLPVDHPEALVNKQFIQNKKSSEKLSVLPTHRLFRRPLFATQTDLRRDPFTVCRSQKLEHFFGGIPADAGIGNAFHKPRACPVCLQPNGFPPSRP